jgi:hypothetical protein
MESVTERMRIAATTYVSLLRKSWSFIRGMFMRSGLQGGFWVLIPEQELSFRKNKGRVKVA